MLVDEVQIQVKAGDGGNGRVSFLHEKFRPKGGPDGGKGGNGGDVYFIGIEDVAGLNRYRFKKGFSAESGQVGGGDRKTGRDGEDLILKVPVGTVIKEVSTGEEWEIGPSFAQPNRRASDGEKRILVAKGGKGGRGNWSFRSATNQTPQEFEPGTPGQRKELLLELRLIADVGLIGLPSVGKTSLLNELTNAGAKVAPYHFTTLEPNLGAMDGLITKYQTLFILADLPGLIDGASSGKGLGIKFLKHIKRTKVLVHLISTESEDPLKDYQVVRKELGDYDKELLDKKEIILITKSDLVSGKQLKEIVKKLKTTKREILPISIHDYDKLQELKKKLFEITKN